MKTWLKLILLTGIALLSSCEYRELLDPVNTHYVRIYVDENILNTTTGFYDKDYLKPYYEVPTIMKLMLCDPNTGETRFERYLRGTGKDEIGNYVDGYIHCEAGDYQLLAYNFGTEATLLRDERNCFLSTAYTNRSTTKADGIFNMPDHLFVTKELIHVYNSEVIDTLYSGHSIGSKGGNWSKGGGVKSKGGVWYGTEEDYGWQEHPWAPIFKGTPPPPKGDSKVSTSTSSESDSRASVYTKPHFHFIANSIVEAFFLQVQVTGIEYATSISATVSGMSENKTVISETMSMTPITLMFDMNRGKVIGSSTRIYANFTTFGRIPSIATEMKITFNVGTVGGHTYQKDIDISKYFDTEDAIYRRWIIMEEVLNIPEPEFSSGGAFNPGVEDWKDVSADIVI